MNLSDISTFAPGAVAFDASVDALLRSGAPCVTSVSGGKDSVAVALAVAKHLNAIGHNGPKLLIHADLGRVEWKDSLPSCERLAQHLGWELVVVRRKSGDMMDRWLSRWQSSVRRYANLETVRLVLPWSTASMRYCTSELKISPITGYLRKRFPSGALVCVNGIRAQESTSRARKPVSKISKRLSRAGAPNSLDWHGILHWPVEDVFDAIDDAGLALHEAYRVHNMTRVSCRFCILSSLHDLSAAAAAEESHDLYREMVGLECESTFSFQSNRWLADIAPQLLTDSLLGRVPLAKQLASERTQIEATIPKSMLFDRRGWPTSIPSMEDAAQLAHVRREVSRIMGMDSRYLDAASVRERIAALHAAKAPA